MIKLQQKAAYIYLTYKLVEISSISITTVEVSRY